MSRSPFKKKLKQPRSQRPQPRDESPEGDRRLGGDTDEKIALLIEAIAERRPMSSWASTPGR